MRAHLYLLGQSTATPTNALAGVLLSTITNKSLMATTCKTSKQGSLNYHTGTHISFWTLQVAIQVTHEAVLSLNTKQSQLAPFLHCCTMCRNPLQLVDIVAL
jgi:hypothetical protein